MINGWWIVSLFVLIHLILQDYGFVGEGFSFGRVPMTKYAFLLFNIT
jgi:DNA-binding transcriptional regulator of glucitol operon